MAKKTDTPKIKKTKSQRFCPLPFLKFGFDLTEKYRIKTALCTLGVSVFFGQREPAKKLYRDNYLISYSSIFIGLGTYPYSVLMGENT
jgi:hypothetical protein